MINLIEKHRTIIGYSLYGLITLGCGLLAWHIGPTALGVVVATPGAASLAAIPWQLFRDQRAHERALEIADRNSAISLGVDSPMARATFDRYVEFAHEYAIALAEVVTEIVGSGPQGGHLNLSQRLASIRRKHVLWIPSETDKALFELEDAIWRMAINAGITNRTPSSAAGWNERWEAAQRQWCSILGISYEPISPSLEDNEAKQAVEVNLQQMALERLRKVLGTEQYSNIRNLAIERALGSRTRPVDRSLP